PQNTVPTLSSVPATCCRNNDRLAPRPAFPATLLVRARLDHRGHVPELCLTPLELDAATGDERLPVRSERHHSWLVPGWVDDVCLTPPPTREPTRPARATPRPPCTPPRSPVPGTRRRRRACPRG